jgi:anti-anti-sigma regulatory factor
MAYEVIRISCHNESATMRLVLEGKLAGACVDELDKCWQQTLSNGAPLLVDLTSVSYVDERGKQLLKRMHEHGAKLFSHRLLSKCLIAEIGNTDNTD